MLFLCFGFMFWLSLFLLNFLMLPSVGSVCFLLLLLVLLFLLPLQNFLEFATCTLILIKDSNNCHVVSQFYHEKHLKWNLFYVVVSPKIQCKQLELHGSNENFHWKNIFLVNFKLYSLYDWNLVNFISDV